MTASRGMLDDRQCRLQCNQGAAFAFTSNRDEQTFSAQWKSVQKSGAQSTDDWKSTRLLVTR